MESCPVPDQTWPQRVPLKVIGRHPEFRADLAAELIQQRLGPDAHEPGSHRSNAKGAYISHTFWVLLPDPASEISLREAFAMLPGYVMQL